MDSTQIKVSCNSPKTPLFLGLHNVAADEYSKF